MINITFSGTGKKNDVYNRLLLFSGIIGPLLFNTMYILEGIFSPGYDWLRQPISDLNSGRSGWIQDANFIVFGFFVGCFGFYLHKTLQKGVGSRSLPLLQVFTALGLLISGIFVQDPLHTMGDVVSFASLILSCFIFAKRFAKDDRWYGWTAYSIITGMLAILFLFLFVNSMHHHGPAGLFERLLIIDRSVWMILLTTRILRGTRLAVHDKN